MGFSLLLLLATGTSQPLLKLGVTITPPAGAAVTVAG